MQRTQVRSQVRELDPTYCKKENPHAATKTQCSQINIENIHIYSHCLCTNIFLESNPHTLNGPWVCGSVSVCAPSPALFCVTPVLPHVLNRGLWMLLSQLFLLSGKCLQADSDWTPHNKESSGPHANSPEVEKPCHKDMLTFLMYFFFLHFCPWSQFSLSHLIQPPSLSPVDLTAPSPSYQDINNLGKVLMAAEAKAPIL